MDDLRREIIIKQEKINQDIQKKRSEDLFCRKCVRYFASKSEFCQHVREHIEEDNDGKTSYMSYIEKYICTSCGQQFEVKSDLVIHYNTVCLDAVYTCKHCSENCENNAFLQMHLLVHHNYSEEMLRDEGFLTDIDNNPFMSENSFIKIYRCKAFKSPPPECTDEFHTAENSASPKASSSNKVSRRFRRKRKNPVYNSVNKTHICEICKQSFSRKCVLDIHAKKHVLKHTKEKRMAGGILKTTSITKSCENTMQECKNIDRNEVPLQHSNSPSVILKQCDVVDCSPTGKEVLPPSSKLPGVKASVFTRSKMRKSKLPGVTTSVTTRSKMLKSKLPGVKTSVFTRSKMRYNKFPDVRSSFSTRSKVRNSKVSDIFEDKVKDSSTHNDISRPSNVVADYSAWKKIKLKSRIPSCAASYMQSNPKNSDKKMKLTNKNSNIAASVEQEDPEALKKSVKCRSNVKNAAASEELKYPETPNAAIKSESRKAKEHKKPPQNSEKKYFICETCKRQFQDKFKLKRHILIHTGERPYTCTKCKKTFARGDHMNRHLKRVCNNTSNSK